MRAAILDGVNAAVDALEQDAFAEHLLAAAFALRQLATEEGRVPVIAEAEARFEIGAPGPAADVAVAFHSWARLLRHSRRVLLSRGIAGIPQLTRKSTTSRLNSVACSTWAQWPQRVKMCICPSGTVRVICSPTSRAPKRSSMPQIASSLALSLCRSGPRFS